MNKIYIVLILLVFQGCGASGSVKKQNAPEAGKTDDISLKHYTDPDGAFSVRLPEDCKIERNRHEEQWTKLLSTDGQAWARLISSDKYKAGRLLVLSLKQLPMDSYPVDLQASMQTEMAKPIFAGWIESLKEHTSVEQISKVYETKLADKDAFHQDVTYHRGDPYGPRNSYGIFLMGSDTALFTALTGNDEGVRALESILSSLQVQSAN
jgi:hypothetical protein